MAEGLVRFKDIAGNDYYILIRKGFVFSKEVEKLCVAVISRSAVTSSESPSW
jgi:hypothetical protein